VKTLAPATPGCNAIGPSCGRPPVAVVVSEVAHQKVLFSDLFCAHHLPEAVAELVAGGHIVAIKRLEKETE